MNTNPILIIDDDEDDLDTITQALAELKVGNEVIIFNDGYKFLEYIKATRNKTFFILCDQNMSKISGLELKQRIYEDEELRLKCMPFILLSTSKASGAVMKAYSFGVQGYFLKPNTLREMMEMLQFIINYWSHSQNPNTI